MPSRIICSLQVHNAGSGWIVIWGSSQAFYVFTNSLQVED